MTGTIYIATNKENGKRYVGQTWGKVSTRIRKHFNEKKETIFSRALRKYGTDNFDIQQIVYSRDSLNEWEQYFISKLITISPSGYNLTSGGDHNYTFSEETRQKIGEAGKGRTTSEETKQKISAAISGENHYRYGKHISEETRKKLSESHKGKKWTPEMRKNYTLARTGVPRSEETKKKISASHKGKTVSEEVKNRLRSYRLGTHYVMPEETKEKIRLIKKGSPKTVEAAYRGWEKRRLRKDNEFTTDSIVCAVSAKRPRKNTGVERR
ncbi:MAG: NUMOD3 domain-containing DNA-binding protein [Candidatus Omnitrophota bacterium]